MKGAGWASINNEEDAGKESEKEEYFYDEEEAKKKPKESNEASFATHVILISLYVLLWTSESLVIHAAKDIDYEKASVTVSIEIFKLTLATGIFIGLNGGKIKDIIAYADRGVLFFMLGLIYCIYNLMRYYALTVSDPGTYRVFINLRVVSTGLLYQFFRVGDPLTPRKWGALILLMIGCSVMKWGELSVAWFPILIIGILAMLGSAGGVYNEKILKTDMAIDINLQNVYLYFFTICFTLLTLLFTDPYLLVSPTVLFRNWTWWMIPMILLGGGGGFMTALMLKHLNVLTKEYANGFEMLMTTLFSFYFFGYPPLDFKVFASIMVVTGSIFLFYWERMPFNRAKEVKS